MHLARLDVDREEHAHRAKQDGLHSEEVERQDPPGLRLQELASGRAVSPWRRPEPTGPQQRADLGRRDPDPELSELTPNPDAPPPRILPSHPQDQLPHLVGDRWPAADGPSPVGPLPSHQLPVPSKKRLRADEERRPPNSR